MARTLAPYLCLKRLQQWLWQHEGHLKERVFRGGVWLFIGNGCSRIAGLVRLAILARLLTPADFGLIGIAMLLIRWFEQFSQIGFRQALVRTPGNIQPYLNTLWTVQVLRGILLATGLFFAAPVAAWFFDHAGAQSVTRALAPLVLLRSLVNPAVVYLKRELDFRRFVWWNLCQVFSGFLVAIPLALIYRNVWALVLSLLVGQAVHTFVSYQIHPFRPRFAFDHLRAREMANFGKWIFGKNLLNALRGNLDGLMVGKLLGASALGLYQVAMRVAIFPSQVMIEILPHVMFPAFAQLQQPIQWRRAYLQVLELAFLFTVPVVAILCIFPHTVIWLFLGQQWLPIVPVMRLLAVYSGINTLFGVAIPLFEGAGRPDLQVKLQCIEVLLSLPVIYACILLGGMQGAAFAIVCVILLVASMQFWMLRHLVGLRLTEAIATIRLGLTAALPLLAFGTLRMVSSLSLEVLVGLGSLSVIVCLVMMWVLLQPHLTSLRRTEAHT